MASAKEQGILWSKDWAREKIPNLTPSSTPVTCPVCLTGKAAKNEYFLSSPASFLTFFLLFQVFTPSRQTDASGCLTKARKFSEALGSAASTAGGGALELALENSFTPEAVAGKWLSVHGCMKWDDWVHERCLETLAGKAKEFQKASGLKYPEIASNKWRELQRWCLHVVQTSQLPPAQTKSKTPKKKEFQTISPISSPPKKKKKKNPSTTNNVFNDSEEDDLRKKMKRAERFQVKAGKKLNKRTHVFHARAAEAEGIVGRCETMCPLAELEKRFWTNDFDELELPSPDFPGMAVEDLAVKRFARTITEEDRQPDRLRTRDTLKRTMNHLLSLMDSKRTTLEKVHRFLWDRFRAIRTDLSIQDIKDTFAVRCYEEMIRFHIIAEHELCEETATVNNPHGFNSHLNVEQMYKCLTSLFSLYDDLAKEGTSCPNEPEFRAYHILLTMDTHGKYRRDKSAHSFALSKTRPEILHSPFVRFAVQLNGLYHDGNYVKFFSVVRKTSFLISCILHAYFDPVRARAIKLLSQGVYGRSGTLPTSDIQEMLLMDNAKDVISLCRSHGLQVQKGKEGAGVAVGQNNFQEITEAVLRKCSKFISSKRSNTKYSDCCVKASTFTQQ